MADLGINAAVMGQVDTTLKHRIGVLSVGIAAAEKVPEQHASSVEIRVTEKENGTESVWQGEALRVIIGNTRRYASILEMTSEASLDDGMLDVCVVMAGDPLSTMQQITSLLVRRRPDNQHTQFFRGAHLSICILASIRLQLDGSAVTLKDYLSMSDREALQCAQDAEHVLVTYRFAALPGVLQVAIPSTYTGPLFERSHQQETPQTSEQQRSVSASEKQPATARDVQRLQEGAEIVVEGKKSKREVIHATRAVV